MRLYEIRSKGKLEQLTISQLLRSVDFDDDEIEALASMKRGDTLHFDKATKHHFTVTCLTLSHERSGR